LAGARRPEEDQELALLGRQADVVDGAELPLLEDLGQIPSLDNRHRQLLRQIHGARPFPSGKLLAPRQCKQRSSARTVGTLTYFHLAKMRLYSASAALTAFSGVSSPRATLANIVGITHVENASEMPAVA